METCSHLETRIVHVSYYVLDCVPSFWYETVIQISQSHFETRIESDK